MKRVLYYVSTFPVFTENFITREIEALLLNPEIDIKILSLKKGTKAVLPESLKEKVIYFEKTKLQRVLSVFVYFKYGLLHPMKFLKLAWKYKARILSLGSAITILPIVENYKPHIIHANWITEGALMANMLSDLSGIPFSICCHAIDIWFSSGVDKKRRIEDADFITTCTKYNKDYLEKIIGKRLSEKINVIYHYIDPNIFNGKVAQFNDKPTLYLIGRKVEKKGFQYFLKAAKILKDRSLAFEARIAGASGPEEQNLLELNDKLGLSNIVKFVPDVTFEEHSHNYLESDVYVIPSIKSKDGDLDGIPYTMVEAAFAGLPIISTNVSAIPELVEDGINGFLVSEKNETELADKLELLIKDKNMRIEFGKKAREKVLEMYGYANTIKKLEELFLKA